MAWQCWKNWWVWEFPRWSQQMQRNNWQHPWQNLGQRWLMAQEIWNGCDFGILLIFWKTGWTFSYDFDSDFEVHSSEKVTSLLTPIRVGTYWKMGVGAVSETSDHRQRCLGSWLTFCNFEGRKYGFWWLNSPSYMGGKQQASSTLFDMCNN